MIATCNLYSDFHLTVILQALSRLQRSPRNYFSQQHEGLSEKKTIIQLIIVLYGGNEGCLQFSKVV